MQPIHDRSEANISEYLSVLRRRWIWVLATIIVAIALVLARDFAKAPVYQSSAQLLLQPKQSESIFQPAPASGDPKRAIQNELKIINSRTVRDAVAKAYKKPIGVTARSGGEDDVIILSATDTDPKEAARKVNVYAQTYQTQRLNAIVADLSKTKGVVQQQLNDFQKAIDRINDPLTLLDAEIAKLPTGSAEYGQKVAERERLNNAITGKREDLQNQLDDYQQRLQLLQLSERLSTTGGVQILNPATVPSTPSSPTPIRDAVQAALLGLLLGVALAFLREQLDDSIRSKADLERATPDLPAIGLIPHDVGWRDSNEERLITQAAPMSATAEAYRGLRTALQYMALDRPMGLVQVTSASAGEGKTSTLVNLALAFAQAGKRVAVVGCDLRKPRVHRFMKVDGTIGMTSVLLGDVPLEEALQQSPVHQNIRVLPSGPPSNPSELLSLDRTAALVRGLLVDHSIVFIDSPPVLPVTDSLVLARYVDATIFLAASNRTSKRKARRAVEMLQQVNTPVIGSVLNGVSAEGTYGSLYEYYGYTQTSSVPLVGRWFKRRHDDVGALDRDDLPEDGRRSRPEEQEAEEAAAGSYRRELNAVGSMSTAGRPLVRLLVHGAERSGPPIHILRILRRWRHADPGFDCQVVLGRPGDLASSFAELADTRLARLDRSSPERLADRLLTASGHHAAGERVVSLTSRFRAGRGERPALTVVNGVTAPTTTLLASLDHGEPVVLIAHELATGWFHNIDAPMRRLLVERTEHYVAVSAAVAHFLTREVGVDPAQISIVPPAVDPSERRGPAPGDEGFEEHRRALRAMLGAGSGDVLVGGGGITDWRKAPDLWLRTAWELRRQAPEATFRFVWFGGDHPEAHSFWPLAREIDLLDLGGRATFLGSVEHPWDVIDALDLFVHTAREDASPLVCLEAMSAGLPLVTFAAMGGAPEMLADSTGAAAPYPDCAAMAAAGLALLDRPNRSRLPAGGAAESPFFVDQVAQKMAGVIRATLGSAPAAR